MRRCALAVLAVVMALPAGHALNVAVSAAQKPAASTTAYRSPRFPSNLKTPRTVDDVMPYTRALARNKSNILGLGLGVLQPGETVLLVGSVASEDIFVDAIKRALIERKVTPIFMYDYDLVGVSKDDASAYRKATAAKFSSERGDMEAAGWFRTFPGGIEYLKERRPDLYDKLFAQAADTVPERLKVIGRKFNGADQSSSGVRNPVVAAILDYMDKHKEIRGVFFGRGGPVWMGFHPYEAKWLGVFVMDNKWDVVTDVSSYPADVWLLGEEMTLEPLAYIDQVKVTDPEGTNASWSLTEEQSQRWAKGVYLRGHLFMFAQEAYGQYAQSIVDYPAIHKDYIPPEPMVLLDGTIAGTNGHGGFFPRIEERFVNGYLKDIKGGGVYGEVLRELLANYPKINEATYPQFKHPGYFYHFETAVGTNPKVVRHPLDVFWGTSPERMRSGVIHWALGAHFWNDPGSMGGRSQVIDKFGRDNKLPTDHGFHIHSYFSAMTAHLRNTKKTLTLIDKGRLTSLDSPEVRALASRYGKPDEILAESWIPEIPGINVPGDYLKDYAPNPYKYSQSIMDKVQAGTYQFFWPATVAGPRTQ